MPRCASSRPPRGLRPSDSPTGSLAGAPSPAPLARLTRVRPFATGAALVGLALTVAVRTAIRRGPTSNRRVIEQNGVKGRTREVPAVNVPMVLADGVPVEGAKLPTATIAPG